MLEEKPFMPLNGEEKETGVKVDPEETEGDEDESRAAILG